MVTQIRGQFVFLCALVLLSAAQAGEWELAKQKDGIAVHTRKVPDSAFREFRGEVEIAANINSLMAVLDDTANFTRWMHQCADAKLLHKESLLQRYQYLVNDFPWPAADRVLLIRNHISQADDRVVTVSLDGVGPADLPEQARAILPENPGAKWVTQLRGFYRLTPLDASRTTVVFQLHLDPAGALPSSLVNSLIVDNPFETLRQLREQAMDAQYAHFDPF